MSKKPIDNFLPTRYIFLQKELDDLKVGEVYDSLIKKLEVNLRDAGDQVLRDLIGSCSNDLRLAGYCYTVAKEDYQRVLDSYDKFLGKYEKIAQLNIMQLKQNKEWAGQTSKESIRSWIAANVPVHKPWFETLRKSKEILDACKILYNAYEGRLSALQTYARLIEKRRGVSVEELNSKDK